MERQDIESISDLESSKDAFRFSGPRRPRPQEQEGRRERRIKGEERKHVETRC